MMDHLSPTQSTLLSALFQALYVGSIYIRRQSRLFFHPNPNYDIRGLRIRVHGERWRDDHPVIQARLYAVCLSTLCSIAIVACVVTSQVNPRQIAPLVSICEFLGFLPCHSLSAYASVPILYSGPLLSRYFQGTLPFQLNWSLQQNVLPKIRTLVGLRNFVIVSPP
jgi:hypothetical protein